MVPKAGFEPATFAFGVRLAASPLPLLPNILLSHPLYVLSDSSNTPTHRLHNIMKFRYFR